MLWRESGMVGNGSRAGSPNSDLSQFAAAQHTISQLYDSVEVVYSVETVSGIWDRVLFPQLVVCGTILSRGWAAAAAMAPRQPHDPKGQQPMLS